MHSGLGDGTPRLRPDCIVYLDKAKSGTARRRLRPSKWMLKGLVASDEGAAELLSTAEIMAGHDTSGKPVCMSVASRGADAPCAAAGSRHTAAP